MNFYEHDDKSIRYTGRWHKGTATACGSYFEIFFKGDSIDLEFDTSWYRQPCPRIYIIADDGVATETAITEYLRVGLPYGEHKLKVIYKSAVEMHHRWYAPLEGKITFKGYHAEAGIPAPACDKKIIEFVGDSITEGVLCDPYRRISENFQENRPFEDDSTATYAWLTAEALGFAPMIMGYGAVGIAKAGCGSVPPAPDAYPYCFDGAPIPSVHPDYVFINHGTNDHFSDKEEFEREYKRLLDVIRACHPDAVIICMNPFGGYHKDSFPCVVDDYNRENGTNVHFIDTTGWAKGMDTHPSRSDHKLLAKYITEEMRKIVE